MPSPWGGCLQGNSDRTGDPRDARDPRPSSHQKTPRTPRTPRMLGVPGGSEVMSLADALRDILWTLGDLLGAEVKKWP